jgi:acylphosphatase
VSAVVRRRVVAHGRVQGVFFRDTVRRRAAGAGVAGWVANRPDGALEAVFEGPLELVAELVELCRHGPPRAEVTGFECTEEDPEGIEGFTVR